MGNVTTVDITNFTNSSSTTNLNNNIHKLRDEFDKVVYKDGREELTGPLDANNQRIYNIANASSRSEPVSYGQFLDLISAESALNELVAVELTAQRSEIIASEGQTVFVPSGPYVVGFMAVYVNGIRLSSTEFNASNGTTVTLNIGASANDVITMESFLGSSVPGDASTTTYTSNGTGAVSQTVKSALDLTVSVKNFGAVGDGIVDDTVAIQNAIDSSNYVEFESGKIYKITSELNITGRANITLVGNGATLKGGSTRFRSYFNLNNSSNVKIENFIFDQLQPSLPTYVVGDYGNVYNCPVYCTNGVDGVLVSKCTFNNLYTSSIYFKDSSNLIVEKNKFTSPVQSQDQWLSFVHIQSSNGIMKVKDNRFINAAPVSPANNPSAVVASGISTTGLLSIENNYVEYCGRDNTGSHRLAVFDLYADGQNVTISNNVSRNTMAQFCRLSTTRKGMIENNRIHMSTICETAYSILTLESGSFAGLSQPNCKNVSVRNNDIEDAAGRVGYAIGVNSYDWGTPSENIEVTSNSIIGCLMSVYVAGPFDNVRISNNDIRTKGRISVEHTPIIASIYGIQTAAKFTGLIVEKNKINTTGAASAAININLNNASYPPLTGTYSGFVGEFRVEKNLVSSSTSVATAAIAVIINASTLAGKLIVKGNETSNYLYDMYPRSTKEVIWEDNVCRLTGSSQLLDDFSNGYIQRKGNNFTGNKLSGTATLVSGTVTISTTEIKTGDTVRITRLASGGTLGHLSLGTLVDSTSFVINSSSVTDTSVVHYEIIH